MPSADLHAEVVALRTSLRRTQRMLAALSVVALAASTLAFSSSAPRQLEGDRLVLRSSDGVAVVSLQPTGLAVHMSSKRRISTIPTGQPRQDKSFWDGPTNPDSLVLRVPLVSISGFPNAGLTIRNPNGVEVGRIGGPMVRPLSP